MRRKFLTACAVVCLCLSLTSCAGESKQASPDNLSLVGEWKQSNGDSEEGYQAAYISETEMEIYWVTDGGDTVSLYWAGSFTPPAKEDKAPYSWESKNDTSKTTTAALASNDGSKSFTYENGEIIYSVSALGTTSTIRMKKEDWGYTGSLSNKNDGNGSSLAESPIPSGNSSDTPLDSSGPQVSQIDSSALDSGEEISLSELEIKEYSYHTDYGNYAFLVVKNNSKSAVSLSANVTFYKEDAMVGASSETSDPVGSGHSTILCFSCDEDFSKMKYEMEPKPEKESESISSDLSYEAGVTENKVILAVTNNGDEPLGYLRATVLFFNGENPVNHDFSYIVDDDSELKPGKTITEEIYCYETFDSYQVFFSGRK